ncbi:hypothetical protein, partial [Streptomyces sp. HG99]
MRTLGAPPSRDPGRRRVPRRIIPLALGALVASGLSAVVLAPQAQAAVPTSWVTVTAQNSG